MRMTASWFRSLDLPHTRLWRDSTAPESGLPSDCHPDCIIVLEAVRMRPGEIKPRTRRWKKCVTLLDSKSPIQGLGRHRPVPLGHKDVRGRPLFALQAPQRAYLGGKGPAAVAGG